MSRLSASRMFWVLSITTLLGGALTSVMTGNDEGLMAAEGAKPAETAAAEHKAEAGKDSKDAKDSSKDAATADHKDGEASAEAKVAEAEKPVTTRRAAPGGCLSDAVAIEDIRRAREEQATRAQELAAKDTELKAREKALEEELRKLSLARDEITKLSGARKKEQEENLAKLVETLETMNPKSASQLVASLEDNLAVTAMSRMNTAKLAKVMNVMEASRVSKLTELLAGVHRKPAAQPVAPPAPIAPQAAAPAPAAAPPQALVQPPKPANLSASAQAKGGEKHDDSSQSGRKPASVTR